MSERSHLCAVGLALLSGKNNSFCFCICCCVFLEAMGYGTCRRCVILQEVDTAVAGIQVVLLAFVYGTTAHSKHRHSPNDHCVSCGTGACVWGSSSNHFMNCLLIPEGKTAPGFRVGGVHLYRSLCFQPLVWEGRWHVPCLSASLGINKHFERI